MSISVKNVFKYYGEQCVLNEVNFQIGSGEIVGFLGPNGAGKSTMMKILTGYVPYETGSVMVCDKEIKDNAIAIKEAIGYLPEHNPLYLEMYVKEYLSFIADTYKLGKASKSRVDEMIQKTGLTAEYKKRIGQLSKGFRQRVGLAQALIHDPKVLILDEPTTGLDPNQLVEVRKLIADLGKEKTVLLSTHIMQEVTALCDRVIIINKGNIVADEKEKNILNISKKNTHILTVELAENVDASIFKAVKGVSNAEAIKPSMFRIESEKDIRGEISRLIMEKELTLLMLSQQERNMEEVFHELTRGE